MPQKKRADIKEAKIRDAKDAGIREPKVRDPSIILTEIDKKLTEFPTLMEHIDRLKYEVRDLKDVLNSNWRIIIQQNETLIQKLEQLIQTNENLSRKVEKLL